MRQDVVEARRRGLVPEDAAVDEAGDQPRDKLTDGVVIPRLDTTETRDRARQAWELIGLIPQEYGDSLNWDVSDSEAGPYPKNICQELPL